MINIYDKNETNFTHNGLAVLSDCKSCYVTEILNGEYYLELEYPKDTRNKYKFLDGLNIIKADGQLFRIPIIYKTMDTGTTVKIRANHVFYDLYYDFIEEVYFEDAVSMDTILSNAISNPRFTLLPSDITDTKSVDIRRTNPIKVVFDLIKSTGELYRDNYKFTLKQNIGTSNGYLVKYGKNLTGITQTLDYDSLATRIIPIGKDDITIDLVNEGCRWLDSPRINDYPFIITKEVLFSNIEDAGELKEEALKLWGKIDLPLINYNVNFIDLSQTEEYKNYASLMTVKCGDTVIVRHEVFGIDVVARVIKTRKNILTGMLEEIELGQFRNTIADTLNSQSDSINAANKNIIEINADLSGTKSQVQQTNSRIALIVTQEGKLIPASIEASINDNQAVITLRGDKILFDTAGDGVGKKVVEIANGAVTADAIKALNLEVGNEIKMGVGSVITWGGPTGVTPPTAENVGARPNTWTPTAADVKALPDNTFIPPEYTDVKAVQAVDKTYIDANGILTKQVKAENIVGNQISGVTLRTIPVGNSGAYIQIYQTYIDFVGSDGRSVFKMGTIPGVGNKLYFSNGTAIDIAGTGIRLWANADHYIQQEPTGTYFYSGNGGTPVGSITDSGIYWGTTNVTQSYVPVFG